ncbi:sensor histidine kinase [Nonomuraea bangladeshensis]|uniref:sensor histidine kinase n=1 Tax=Nonomuraea bangladeshensis TaxID=404385 RepID=UPI003C2FDFBB
METEHTHGNVHEHGGTPLPAFPSADLRPCEPGHLPRERRRVAAGGERGGRVVGRLRGPLSALARLRRAGDIPVVVMLAWAGWLAVPWSFSGLAQARAAAAAAAAEPPRLEALATDARPAGPEAFVTGAPPARPEALAADAQPARPEVLATGTAPLSAGVARAAWGLPAVSAPQLPTVRPASAPAEASAEATAEAAVLPHPAALAEQAIAAERARIAGEVHDAAGHGLAAIAMQAGLALVTLDDDPEQTRASLRAIKETSTAALAQLRAALDGIDPPAGDLTALIDGVRAAGLPVDVEPAGLPVPPQLRDTVYRVVRESLTNVLRHAGPTRALVRMTDAPTAYVLEIADRGPGAGQAAEGRGLRGMRARVTEAGGHFAAGPREGGGFQVTARFPHPPDRGQA